MSTCPTCNGEGYIGKYKSVTNSNNCPTCHGTGSVPTDTPEPNKDTVISAIPTDTDEDKFFKTLNEWAPKSGLPMMAPEKPTPDQPQADDLEQTLATLYWARHNGLEYTAPIQAAYQDIQTLITREREQAKREVLEELLSTAYMVEFGDDAIDAEEVKIRLAALTPNEPKEAE